MDLCFNILLDTKATQQWRLSNIDLWIRKCAEYPLPEFAETCEQITGTKTYNWMPSLICVEIVLRSIPIHTCILIDCYILEDSLLVYWMLKLDNHSTTPAFQLIRIKYIIKNEKWEIDAM